MHKWMNPFRKQNPLVLRQILENQAFFVGSRMGLWKCSIERSRSKWHSVIWASCGGAITSARFSSPSRTLRIDSIAN